MTPEEATRKLFQAAESGNLIEAEAALDAGASPNSRNDFQETPLHCAATNGQIEIARLLLRSGANVNAKDFIESTPLHCAACFDRLNTARLLIENGADVNAKSSLFDATPLHVAALYGHDEILLMLKNAMRKEHAELWIALNSQARDQ